MSNDPLLETLKASQSEKRGVTVALSGTTIALLVREIRDGCVIGASQAHDRIVIRLEAIEAAYM